VQRLDSIRPPGLTGIAPLVLELVEDLLRQTNNLPAASEINSSMTRDPHGPGQYVAGIAELAAVFDRAKHGLLENVVGRVYVSNNGRGDSYNP
jgi:hypothetical protein